MLSPLIDCAHRTVPPGLIDRASYGSWFSFHDRTGLRVDFTLSHLSFSLASTTRSFEVVAASPEEKAQRSPRMNIHTGAGAGRGGGTLRMQQYPSPSIENSASMLS